jgi:periplasmic divalent cation tolerance protein
MGCRVDSGDEFSSLHRWREILPLLAMKSASDYSIVLVTAPNLRIARVLAKAALRARLVACANLVLGLESHYWWQGKLERSGEVLVVFKTVRRRLTELEKLVITEHPYDTPEFVVLPLTAGNKRYLDWFEASVK